MTGNNRSILLKRLISDQFIDLNDFNFLLEEQSSFQIMEQLIAREKETKLCLYADSRDEQVNLISTRLRKLQRVNKFIFDERGAQDLYVGWPFVRGQMQDGTLIRCPLLFFPIDIFLDGKYWKMALRQDVNVTFNKSFLLAYSHFNQIVLPESLYDENFDEWDKDSRIFRTNLYKLFKDSDVELNFNQEVFIDKIEPFESLTKKELESTTKIGELKLYPEAVVGIFPQAGSYIVPDYNFLLENNLLESVEDLFLAQAVPKLHALGGEPLTEEYAPRAFQYKITEIGEEVKEENIFTPFAMDGSQEKAIRAIKAGHSIVVQGPPGTGKSQLIANVIADAIAKGKRVLLVSQKKAALDVVHKRLDEKQLEDFVALVHDFKWDRKKIYDQIMRQIDRVPEYKASNYGLDTIQLERKFLHASRRIEQIKEELNEFRNALFDEDECGLTVKELYLTSNKNTKVLDLRQEYPNYKIAEIAPFLRRLRTFYRLSSKLSSSNYPWKDRKSFASYGTADFQQMLEIINGIYPFRIQLCKKLEELLSKELNFTVGEEFLSREAQIRELVEMLNDPDVYENFQYLSQFKSSAVDADWLSKMEDTVLSCFSGEGIEFSLPSDKLGDFQDVLHKSLDSRGSAVKWLLWKFADEKEWINEVLDGNNLTDTKKDLHVLAERMDNRLNLEHNLSALKQVPWVRNLPEEYRKLSFQEWFILQKKTVIALNLYYSIRNFNLFFNPAKLTYTELREQVEQMLRILKEIPAERQKWMVYLTPIQVDQLLASESKAKALSDVLDEDFDLLNEFDRLQESLDKEEKELIQKIISSAGDVQNEEELEAFFTNSLKLAWIHHIEAKYPILRIVSTSTFQELEIEMRTCVEDKAKISQEMLLMKVREQTYQNLEYNRLNNLVTYRDLKHQVTKKRKIWPIRKLVSTFEDEVFKLVPCWMASPEAVSAIFPMREMFDLVIFDEASQCFVEKGIPAMFRAKQVVVTGDDKQLQPNDLYQIRWESDDEDEEVEMEIDSLLALARQHLMQVQLTGHYRSKSPELIEFSNTHFYENRLEMIPAREISNEEEPAIRYVKVDGIWENNVNKTEALAVVDLVFKLLNIESEKVVLAGRDGEPWYEPRTIGVVTFNAKQQAFIMDLLEDQAQKENVTLPSTLFVKNIENVQGDERDIIVFSTAYAPDKEGKMVMQFGSLNAEHGENRLNVAVTRAREKIYMVSSIYPNQLKVEDTKNPGPKLFKAYLQYALNVSEGKYQPHPKEGKKRHINWFLKDKIKELLQGKGFEIKEIQPFADLTVEKEGKYVGLIMTDDDQFYQTTAAKEMHVYKYQSLDDKHWPYKLVFSREYWKNSEELKEKLNRYIHHINA